MAFVKHAGDERLTALDVLEGRGEWPIRQIECAQQERANDEQAYAYNDLIREGALDPCVGRVAAFDEIGTVHADMDAGALPPGNTVILVGAQTADEGARR